MSDRSFSAPWWAANRHVQTLWGKLLRSPASVPTRHERWHTPDDDFLDLHRLDAPAGRPRLLALHGLEGTIRSHYLAGVLTEAHRHGWGADILLFRSCGPEPNRAARLYHSGETSDLDHVLRRIVADHPESPIALVGFSLGGNVLLKWLGEQGPNVPAAVRAACAVSVPFDLSRSADHICRGFARVYQAHFLRSLRRKTEAKMRSFPDLVDPRRLESARTIRDFDDAVTARVHGFAGADDYYRRSSSIRWLDRIRVPTLLLSSADDPFLPGEVLREVEGIAQRNPALQIDFTERGGHVGFVAGLPWKPVYWADRRIARHFERHFPE